MKYSPEYYLDLEKRYPQIAKDFDKLAQDCHEAGPLDQKCRRFTKLGIAVGIGSEGDVQSHVIQALDEGITPDEIRHAILQSLTTAGFPQMIVAMSWAEEIIQKKNSTRIQR
jgi:alkylhydroperoxidase/carboxymuconolactone decarboxylase family protein YurZ